MVPDDTLRECRVCRLVERILSWVGANNGSLPGILICDIEESAAGDIVALVGFGV